MITSKSKTSGAHKKVWIIVAALSTAAVAGGATFALWNKGDADLKRATDLARKGPEELRKAVDAGQIPREVAWEAFGEARRVEFEKRIDGYFALTTQRDRQKYLDQMIDEMEAQRKRWEAERAQRQQQAGQQGQGRRRGDGPTSRPTTRPADDRERQQRMMARSDAQPAARRAQMIEFRNAMSKRMQERGIQNPMRGFGGGPGGGFGGGPGR